ncbi:hypothetical protein [Micromonospora sp. C28ISP2-4]|uniref:hypothetical protein n=1 Tax=Micromonospora sp. C28ISP2-4 TaxID=3059523 RepID=UPI0026773BAA|nr:hypothetical protein [Micromonospora sp. C28ISP2-4]MDO3686502.1 hypothetical protein [Micromonospora sp. C28ISP2-4]
MERFTMNVVDRLVPGVTTVTLNARYYALHGLISAEAQRRGLPRSAAQSLLRRAEVVVGAVSARHYRAAGFAHEALSRPHGYDEILRRASDGGVDVAELAAPGVYAKPNWGFWPAYRGSEVLLRIVTRADDIGPGDQMDTRAVAQGLGDVLDLVSRRTLDDATLDAYESLCICHSATSADGAWLARLFAASDAETPATRAGVRRQTLRMIARVIQLTEVRRVTRDVSRFLAYEPEAMSDPVLSALELSDEWRGLILRNYSVTAWRSLWAWLVNGIHGLTPRAELAAHLADLLPDSTVGAFRDGLPRTMDSTGRPVPAEHDPGLLGLETPVRDLSVLALGARRVRELAGRELHGFEGHEAQDRYEQLAPRWLADQLDRWHDRSLRDFARWLADTMVDRSQRLALAKARLDPRKGVLKIPTRVHLRDDLLFRDSDETAGSASLRWDQLAGILAGMGLLARTDAVWGIGDRGDLIA